MKKFLGFRPREQRLALIAALFTVCWLVVTALLQPLWDRARDLSLSIDTQSEKLRALTDLMAQAQAIERRYREAAPWLETDTGEGLTAAFLNELESLSQGLQVKVNFKPRMKKRDQHVSRYEIELDAEGPQQDLLVFLDALLRLHKLIAIERLRLSIIPTRERMLRANLVIQKLALTP
jgi:hypothetical protein